MPEALQSAGHETILVLPPASTTRFELTAPKGLKRDEWPLLVARYRCDEGNGEPLTLARLDHVQGRLVLVGVTRSRLQDWQATLARAGLSPTAWAPAFMGQPDPPERALCALPAGDDWMLRWRDDEEDQAPGRCHWLSWPRNTALPPPWPSASGISRSPTKANWPVWPFSAAICHVACRVPRRDRPSPDHVVACRSRCQAPGPGCRCAAVG
nr:hypothetical protein [Halomonas elongata]